MKYTRFEWCEEKNRYNFRKHGISFTDAVSIFRQPHLARLDDRRNYGEDRWLAIGWIAAMIGVVVFTEREDSEGSRCIRIISARRASKRESRHYEKEIGH